MNIFGLFPNEDPTAEEQIDRKLRAFLGKGQMSLLPNVDWGEGADELDFSPHEGGESADLNWIFTLYLPTLSDHLYWIIVPRDGTTDAYIYGFN